MALTQQQQTAVRNIITQEGSVEAVVNQICSLGLADKKAAAITALRNAVSVTVTDWQTPAQYVTQAKGDALTRATLASVIQDITAAWTARDQNDLGPLFVQLYAAAKAKLGQ
jgi:hypothetical protein